MFENLVEKLTDNAASNMKACKTNTCNLEVIGKYPAFKLGVTNYLEFADFDQWVDRRMKKATVDNF